MEPLGERQAVLRTLVPSYRTFHSADALAEQASGHIEARRSPRDSYHAKAEKQSGDSARRLRFSSRMKNAKIMNFLTAMLVIRLLIAASPTCKEFYE